MYLVNDFYCKTVFLKYIKQTLFWRNINNVRICVTILNEIPINLCLIFGAVQRKIVFLLLPSIVISPFEYLLKDNLLLLPREWYVMCQVFKEDFYCFLWNDYKTYMFMYDRCRWGQACQPIKKEIIIVYIEFLNVEPV